MSQVINGARPEAQPPTRGQFVQILQSTAESHLPSKKNYDDAAFVAARTAQTFPAADDRALITGADANRSGNEVSLMTDTYVSWTTSAGISQGSKGNAQGLLFAGDQGNIGNPATVEASQALSAGWVTGDYVELKFTFEHRKKSLLQISFADSLGDLHIEGLTGGLPGEAANGTMAIYLSGVARRDTSGTVTMYLRDTVGDMQADAYNFTLTKIPSSTP